MTAGGALALAGGRTGPAQPGIAAMASASRT
jgi:hypothetical protein